jgi:hypothetical protein
VQVAISAVVITNDSAKPEVRFFSKTIEQIRQDITAIENVSGAGEKKIDRSFLDFADDNFLVFVVFIHNSAMTGVDVVSYPFLEHEAFVAYVPTVTEFVRDNTRHYVNMASQLSEARCVGNAADLLAIPRFLQEFETYKWFQKYSRTAMVMIVVALGGKRIDTYLVKASDFDSSRSREDSFCYSDFASAGKLKKFIKSASCETVSVMLMSCDLEKPPPFECDLVRY